MSKNKPYLKPCPFCGGKAILRHYGAGNELFYQIHCGNLCGGTVRDDFIREDPELTDSDPEAIENEIIKAWNRRTKLKEEFIKDLVIFDN